jgi:hypothetical protein
MGYTAIQEISQRQESFLRKICIKHTEYIEKLKFNEKRAIRLYIEGILMSLKRVSNVFSNFQFKYETMWVSRVLAKVIANNTPLQNTVHLFQAQIENKNAAFETGDVIFRLHPFSTSMYYPFSFEWLIERLAPQINKRSYFQKLLGFGRKYPINKKLVFYVYKIPKKSKISLCVGCPSLMCDKTYKKKILNNNDFQSVTNQLQTQSEVILSYENWKVYKVDKMTFSDIKNFNKYGKGWYRGLSNQKYVNDKSPISIVYLKPITRNELTKSFLLNNGVKSFK